MKKYKRNLLLSLIGLLFLPLTTAFADDAGIGFSIEPIYSSNQIDNQKDFYYLMSQPGKEQTIEVDVMGESDKPIAIQITAENAISQSNGEIGYTSDLEKLDETLKAPFTSFLVDGDKENIINIKPGEKKRVQIKLKAPTESFPGIKIGSLTFSEAKEEEETSGVANEYKMRIGVLLTESGDTYNDAESLNLLNVKPTVKNSRKLVVGTLQNPEPKLLDRLNLKGEIKNKKNGKVIKTVKASGYSLAPNSHMDLEFDWGIDSLKSGDYEMIIAAKSPIKEWALKKDFSISQEVADKVNEESDINITTPNWMKIVTIILGSLAIILSDIIIIRINRHTKKWQKLKIRKKNRKKKIKRK